MRSWKPITSAAPSRAARTKLSATTSSIAIDVSRAIFEVTDRIASFDWTLEEVGQLHKQLAKGMSDEVTTLNEQTAERLLASGARS